MRKPSEADRWPGDVGPIRLDVRDEESVRSSLRTVLNQAGRIDALVNNAGYTLVGSLEETSIEEATDLFETNFFGVLRMTQPARPFIRETNYRRIVTIVSPTAVLT